MHTSGGVCYFPSIAKMQCIPNSSLLSRKPCSDRGKAFSHEDEPFSFARRSNLDSASSSVSKIFVSKISKSLLVSLMLLLAAMTLSRIALPCIVCDIIASTNCLTKRTEAWNEDWVEYLMKGPPSLVDNARILRLDVESGGWPVRAESAWERGYSSKVVVYIRYSSETKGPHV